MWFSLNIRGQGNVLWHLPRRSKLSRWSLLGWVWPLLGACHTGGSQSYSFGLGKDHIPCWCNAHLPGHKNQCLPMNLDCWAVYGQLDELTPVPPIGSGLGFVFLYWMLTGLLASRGSIIRRWVILILLIKAQDICFPCNLCGWATSEVPSHMSLTWKSVSECQGS